MRLSPPGAGEVNKISEHTRSKEVADRLAKIEGHVRGIKRMAEEGKECEDLLLQISAVQAALKKTGQIILADHLEHCIADALRDGNGEAALEKLTKALERVL